MFETLSSPPVIASLIGGVFAISCKVLEILWKKPDDANRPPRSLGLLGWAAVISAFAAIAFSIISLSMNRVTVLTDGQIAGDKRAETTLTLKKPALVLITVQVEATGNQGQFRTALTPQLLVNKQIVAATMNRNTNGDAIRHQVSLTAYIPLPAGSTPIEVIAAGDEIHSEKITGHYIALSK